MVARCPGRRDCRIVLLHRSESVVAIAQFSLLVTVSVSSGDQKLGAPQKIGATCGVLRSYKSASEIHENLTWALPSLPGGAHIDTSLRNRKRGVGG